jgi:putative SOS response-associated peptidase YedK
MCFYFRQSKEALEVANRFRVKLKDGEEIIKSSFINGFTHPHCSLITDREPELVQNFEWGVIPRHSDRSIQRYTLNARIESISERRSYKNLITSRCLVIADGFYEWKEGVPKKRYLISLPDNSLFAFAALYSCWKTSPEDSEIRSFTILTTEANELVASVHKRGRMPVILHQKDEIDWLSGIDYNEFAYPYSRDLFLTESPVDSGISEKKRARNDDQRTLF